MWYKMLCLQCAHEWDTQNGDNQLCGWCGNIKNVVIASGPSYYNMQSIDAVWVDGNELDLAVQYKLMNDKKIKEKQMKERTGGKVTPLQPWPSLPEGKITCTDVNKFKAIREAFEGVLDKWESIANDDGVDLGTKNCALCQVFGVEEISFPMPFSHIENHPCRQCPVGQKTGRNLCGETPYADWKMHQVDEHGMECDFKVICEECHRLALNFKRWLSDLFIECMDEQVRELLKQLDEMFHENKAMAEELHQMTEKKEEIEWQDISSQLFFQGSRGDTEEDFELLSVRFYLYWNVPAGEGRYINKFIGKLYEGKLELSDSFKDSYLIRPAWEGEDFRLAIKRKVKTK